MEEIDGGFQLHVLGLVLGHIGGRAAAFVAATLIGEVALEAGFAFGGDILALKLRWQGLFNQDIGINALGLNGTAGRACSNAPW